jgi:Na+/H+ antiporter NhaA
MAARRLFFFIFFIVPIELKSEPTVGHLNNVSKAVGPVIAALGGELMIFAITIAMVLYFAIQEFKKRDDSGR